jgi:hypothetical protein
VTIGTLEPLDDVGVLTARHGFSSTDLSPRPGCLSSREDALDSPKCNA